MADQSMVTMNIEPSVASYLELHRLLKEVGISDSWLAVTLMDVDKAMVESLSKHGRPTRDPQRGLCHCTEELGEVAKEATDAMRGASEAGPQNPKWSPDTAALRRMYTELCQLSAYSALLATSMMLLRREIEDGKRKG